MNGVSGRQEQYTSVQDPYHEGVMPKKRSALSAESDELNLRAGLQIRVMRSPDTHGGFKRSLSNETLRYTQRLRKASVSAIKPAGATTAIQSQ